MRFVPVLALAALLASPALAQTQYADSSGGFVSLNGLSFSSNDIQSIDGTLGYRFSSGADVGFRVRTVGYDNSSAFQFGPVLGITRSLGGNLTGRIEGSVQYIAASSDYPLFDLNQNPLSYGGHFSRHDLEQDLTATVSRPIGLLGSLSLRPTLGLYTGAAQRLSFVVPEGVTLSQDRFAANAGLHAELPITFRLFGQSAALVPVARFRLIGDLYSTSNIGAYAGGGFRLNF